MKKLPFSTLLIGIIVLLHTTVEFHAQCLPVDFTIRNPNFSPSSPESTVQLPVISVVIPPNNITICYVGKEIEELLFIPVIPRDSAVSNTLSLSKKTNLYCYHHLNNAYTYFNSPNNWMFSPSANLQFPVIFEPSGSIVLVLYDNTLNKIKFKNPVSQQDVASSITGLASFLLHHTNAVVSSANTNHVVFNDGLIIGSIDYLIQSYKRHIGAYTDLVFTYELIPTIERPTRRTDNSICLNEFNNANDRSMVWSTLLVNLENVFSPNIVIPLLNYCYKDFTINTNQRSAAEMLLSKAILHKSELQLSNAQLCTLKNIIKLHYSCLNNPLIEPDLSFHGSGALDYYIADDASDIGIQPNPSNASEWESPAIINRQSPDGQLVNQAAIADVENTLYIEIGNNGCDTLTDGVLQVYYALSQTGLSWDDAWIENTITVGNTEILAGAKIAEIFLPSISTQTVRIPVSWTPPDIEGLNVSETKINILARIISATDVMYAAEGRDIRTNVRNNNNVAWKVLTLEK
ncbi:MAG: hypothetical protein IPM42_08790 [Saprospiraceae bacterium]|nr:hypothetical protein [Saprospiraceae bacterium]